MLRRALVLPLAVGLVLAACAGDPSTEDAGPEQAARFGLIAVTYSHDWSQDGAGMLLSSAAQFVRFSALNREQVAQLLALPLDPDRDLPAVDRCRLYDLSPELAASAGQGENEEQGQVELLEAGELKVQTASRTVTLAPKHFPGLLPFVSGVIYGEAEAALVENAGQVQAISSGGEAVGAFTAGVTSPELPRLLAIGGRAPGEAIALGRDRDLTLRWTPARSREDLTYLELRFARDKRDLALRCRLKDDGAFEVPAGQLAEVSGQVTLEVSRLRRSLFTAGGLDQAELRVTVRDTALLE